MKSEMSYAGHQKIICDFLLLDIYFAGAGFVTLRRTMIQTLFAIVFLYYPFGIDAGMGDNNILNVTLKLNLSTRGD